MPQIMDGRQIVIFDGVKFFLYKDSMKNKSASHKTRLGEKIIDEAAGIISTRGPEGVSMRKLSRKLDISRMAPYYYFKNKDELIQAAAETGFKRLHGKILFIIQQSGEPGIDLLKKIGLAYVQYARQETNFFRLIFTNVADRRYRFSGCLSELSKFSFSSRVSFDTLNNFLGLVMSLQAKGVLKKTPPLIMANTIWAFFHGISLMIIDHQIKISCPVDEFLAQSLDLFFKGICEN